MKKKSVIILTVTVILAALTLAFAACGKKEENQTQTDVYTQLNAMLGEAGYPAVLTSKTTENGYVFNGTYTIAESEGTYTVEYSYEKLSTFGISDAGEITLPEDFKTTCTGSLKVRDGKIVEQNGAEANLSPEALTVSGIHLSEASLTDVADENGTFSATVTSLQTVTGITSAATSATLVITHTDTAVTRLKLTYVTASYQTEITYEFN